MLTNKLHILFLCGWFPSKVSPNNGDFIERHAEAVAKKHAVSVLHIITDCNQKVNIKIQSQEKNNVISHIAYLKKTNNSFLKILLYRKAFFLLLAKIDAFDLVHLNEIYPFGIFGLYLKWFQKKPFIISEHWTGYLKSSNKKISYFKKLISKYIVKKSYAICNVSNFLTKNMLQMGFKGNFVTISNVINTKLFIPKKKKENHLKLIHVSSLKNEHKNIKGMLNVAKLLDHKIGFFEWKFIGNNGNDYLNYLKELNLKNGKISFLDHITQKELTTNLQEADLCISFSNYETFGLVIPEAIACGTPVIATETGIAIDFKDTKFCSVIPVKDEMKLLEEILKYKTTFKNLDPKEMHDFVKQKFSIDVINSKFSILYKQSLNK